MSKDMFHMICFIWGGISLITFCVLLFVKAPYGRHSRKGWGPSVPNRMGWILMELPSFACILFFYLNYEPSSYASLLLILWLVHYANRTFVFPIRIRTQGKRMPLVIVLSAILFNLINAGLNGYYLSLLETYQVEDFSSWKFLAGLGIFLIGALVNVKSDHILIHLRKPSEIGYKIPRGFLFKYVSCPNHLGEIVQWGGFALMAWNYPATTFFLWTASNLIPRALDHHRWYKERFEDYPTRRKAIFPGIL